MPDRRIAGSPDRRSWPASFDWTAQRGKDQLCMCGDVFDVIGIMRDLLFRGATDQDLIVENDTSEWRVHARRETG